MRHVCLFGNHGREWLPVALIESKITVIRPSAWGHFPLHSESNEHTPVSPIHALRTAEEVP